MGLEVASKVGSEVGPVMYSKVGSKVTLEVGLVVWWVKHFVTCSEVGSIV